MPVASDETPRRQYKGKGKHMSKAIVIDRQKFLASAFRKHMTEGQDDSSNSYRRAFYKRVTDLADKVYFLSFPAFVRMTVFPSSWKRANFVTTKKDLGSFRRMAEACQKQANRSAAS